MSANSEATGPQDPDPVLSEGGPQPSSAAFLARTSVLLAGATLLSRLLGLVREMIIAHFYGATGQTDSFFFALIIPELLRTLIISGAVASVFIPLMTETQRAGKAREARRLAGVIISFISLLAVAVIIPCELAAPWLVQFSEVLSFAREPLDPERLALTTELIRLLLPIVLLVGLWGLMGGILNALDNFHVPGLAPLAWNGTIIVLLLIFGWQCDVRHIAWAFVLGHIVQVLMHIPALWRAGIRPLAIDWNHPMLRKFMQLAPVAVLAYAAPAVNAFIGQGIALNLSESAASSLAYAFRIQQLPLAIFGVSVATALFPTLSRHAAAGSGKDLVTTLARGLRMTALATLPAVIFFLIMPAETIRLLLERGQFTSENTADVAIALFWYAWAILPMALLLLTARTFFSEKDMRTPAVLGLVTIAVYYVAALSLSRVYGFSGIALSTGAVAWLVLVISVGILHRRYRTQASLLTAIGGRAPSQMIIAGVIEAGVLWGYRVLLGPVQGTWALLGMILLGAALGAVVYLGLLWLMRSDDLSSTLDLLFRRR